MLESGKKLSELASEMEEFPQILMNVAVKDRTGWDQTPEIASAIADAERKLSGRGRVLVRPSGTEKLIRVMAEGPDMAELKTLTGNIAEAIKSKIG